MPRPAPLAGLACRECTWDWGDGPYNELSGNPSTLPRAGLGGGDCSATTITITEPIYNTGCTSSSGYPRSSGTSAGNGLEMTSNDTTCGNPSALTLVANQAVTVRSFVVGARHQQPLPITLRLTDGNTTVVRARREGQRLCCRCQGCGCM